MYVFQKTICVSQASQRAYDSRYSGKRVRQAVLKALAEGPAPVVLDFKDVDFVAPGFADELVGVLVYNQGLPWLEQHIRLVNLDPDVGDDIQQAIRWRQRLRDQHRAVAGV